jgi:hypothetical protein
LPESSTLITAVLALGFLLGGGIAAYLLSANYRKRSKNLLIVKHLDIIRLAANEKRLHPDQKAKVDVDAAFLALEKLIHGSPTSVHVDLDEMKDRWEALNLQLTEFSEQSTVSTLRSSIMTTRTDRLANEIMELAKHMEHRLD